MDRKFTVVVFDHSDPATEVVLFRTFAAATGFDPRAFKRELEQMIDDATPEGKVTSSRVVVVTGIDEAVNARFLEDSPANVGFTTPTNGLFAQRVEVGQEFPSAVAASLHLGLKNNEVALYLNKAKTRPVRERVALIRGVTLQYRSDYNQALLGDLRD